jgi:hypothetical protein
MYVAYGIVLKVALEIECELDQTGVGTEALRCTFRKTCNMYIILSRLKYVEVSIFEVSRIELSMSMPKTLQQLQEKNQLRRVS